MISQGYVEFIEDVANYYIQSYSNADESFQVEKFKRPNRMKESISYQSKKQEVKHGLYQRFGRNGKLDLTGQYEEGERIGEWEYFHANGETSAKGSYKNGVREGVWQSWDEKGKLDEEKFYVAGNLEGEYKEWKNKKLIQSGQYKADEMNGEWTRYWENGKVDEKGTYENGNKVGEWNYYFKSGQLAAQELYVEGEIPTTLWWNEDGTTKAFDASICADPQFPGGQDAMIRFIQKNLVYPPVSIDSDERGKVFIKFTVEVNGNINDVDIVRSVTEDLDDETIRIIKAMPKWTPGTDHNRVKPTLFVLPISFRLG